MNPSSSDAGAGSAAAPDTQAPDLAAKQDSATAPPAAGNEAESPDGAVSRRAEVNAGRIHGAAIVNGTQINSWHAEVGAGIVRSAENVLGVQVNNYASDARQSMPDAWQDDLFEVPLSESAQGGNGADIDVHVDALLRTHLLLVRHAPTAAAEAQARVAVRAAVHSLQGRRPGQAVFSSKFDRPFPP